METMKQTEALAQFDDAVYKYAHQWMRYPSVSSEYDLEDLAQIGRIYILKALEEYDPSAGMKLSTYIIQRIRWGLNTSLRSVMPKAKRETKHFSIDALTEEQGDRWHPCVLEYSDTFEDMISALTEQDQRILTLRFVDGLTLEQIGAEFGRSYEWARLTIEKATNKLED
jgi:RNA polymerase sigma factor (sigma-70 family)